MLKFMLHRKIDQMSAAAAKLVSGHAVKCKLWSFGEYGVDPRLLESFKKLPAENGWPAESCADVVFEVESQETIDRKFEGNWSFRFS